MILFMILFRKPPHENKIINNGAGIKMKKIKISGVFCAMFFVLMACSEEKSDEERILEDIDSTSVHLTVGLKVIVSNPENDPDIVAAQETIQKILKASPEQNGTDGLSLSEMGQLAKIAYQAKSLGEKEVALGKSSDFRFLTILGRLGENTSKPAFNVEQDHAMTLAGMYLLKIYPAIPLPITKKTLLYEAWMSGNAEVDNEFVNGLLLSAQIATFAKNDYCDFAWKKTEAMRKIKIKKINTEAIKENFQSSAALGRIAAHAPQLVGPLTAIILAPTILEMTPGTLKIIAHVEVAGCFDRKGNVNKALTQYEYAIETMGDMGVPENELAIFKAFISYKKKDFDEARKHLKNAAKSELLDKRSKQDLIELAENIESPDDSMIDEYLSSTRLTIAFGEIIHQRLIDEGVYDNIKDMAQLKRVEEVLGALMAVDADNVLDMGKGLLDKIN